MRFVESARPLCRRESETSTRGFSSVHLRYTVARLGPIVLAMSAAQTILQFPPEVSEKAALAIWPLWKRVLFRFFFVYLLLQITPWNWFDAIPGVGALSGYIFNATNWLVQQANAHVFHVREKLVMINGSGDTSWAWT